MRHCQTLRMPKEIAEQAAVVAKSRGVSLNALAVEALIKLLADINMEKIRNASHEQHRHA